MQRVSWKCSWAAGGLCSVLMLLGVALLAPTGHGEAPSSPAQAKPARPAKPDATRGQKSTKAAPKAAATRAKPKSRSSTRTAKARAASTTKARARPPSATKSASRADDDVATGPDEVCHVQLRKAGVSFVKVMAERAPRVQLPIRLTGSVSGVEIRGTGKNKATHYLDCRLALALVRWAPQLGAAGVVRIDHYSIYRQDAQVGDTRKPSGHSAALAIDAGRFHLSDGRMLTVLETWKDKTKGSAPCSPRPMQDGDERLVRELVCEAARRGIFQTIVTPHHNPDHDNHVHLEVSGSLAPTWIH